MQYGSKLLFLKEKQVNFLLGKCEVDSLKESEKVHLKILLTQANQSEAFKEVLMLYGDIDINQLVASMGKVDCIDFLLKKMDNLTIQSILAKVFETDWKQLDDTFNANDYPGETISDYQEFAKNSKILFNLLEITAYNYHHDSGLDYKESDLVRYWNEFIYNSYQTCPKDEKLNFYRLLPRAQQEYIRDKELKLSNPDYCQLIPGFQTTVENEDMARGLLSSQAEHSLIFFYDDVNKEYHVAFMDECNGLISLPIQIDEKKFMVDHTVYETIEDFYNKLSEKYQHKTPLVESKEQSVTPKQSRISMFDASSQTDEQPTPPKDLEDSPSGPRNKSH